MTGRGLSKTRKPLGKFVVNVLGGPSPADDEWKKHDCTGDPEECEGCLEIADEEDEEDGFEVSVVRENHHGVTSLGWADADKIILETGGYGELAVLRDAAEDLAGFLNDIESAAKRRK